MAWAAWLLGGKSFRYASGVFPSVCAHCKNRHLPESVVLAPCFAALELRSCSACLAMALRSAESADMVIRRE